MANKLQHETSPYLKQHAHNPVDWHPWGKDTLEKAKSENKLIIVSIGYSACHWCHVMERESFENDIIAQTMNTFFVSIKVDREERPDIDQIYMIAVQLMTNSGGWPLHVICLPDGRPIYGGTYFKPKDWQNILLQIAQMWEETPNVALEYAEKLSKGIKNAERLPIAQIPEAYTTDDILEITDTWKKSFDTENGGYNRTPKFPLPNNWSFLLRYGVLTKDQETLDHVHFTLRKIANGGIYDHIGGGFARYSVDPYWHVPHFEKMLYDNGQLISLYSEAYQQKPDPLYKRTVQETIHWLELEMLAENGGFYSALDADTEGVEGKFYTFEEHEFDILGTEKEQLKKYYNINTAGNWAEEKTNVLFVQENEELSALYTEEKWNKYLKENKTILFKYREARTKPGIDDKQLVSWNALVIKGLCDAFRVFETDHYLDLALETADFILDNCLTAKYTLLHQPEDANRKIDGFLDDYAFTIEAFASLYEATFDEKWLYTAEKLIDSCIDLFFDQDAMTFYYTSQNSEILITRKSEVMDNVIPSSLSTMVHQLYKLGLLLDKSSWTGIADQIFANVFPHIKQYGSAYSNWAITLLHQVYGTNEIALTGKDAKAWKKEVEKHFIPNKIILGGEKSSLPLLSNRQDLESKAYLCRNKTCSLPQSSIAALLELINE